MNLRDLQYVLSVADTGQFGEAAKRCHVSQPTLSTQIKKLEAELGQPLFERNARGAQLTAFGRKALPHMRVMIKEADYLRELTKMDGGPFGGQLRLGVIPTAGPYLLPHVLPALRRTYPELRVQIREAMTATLLQSLHAAELDAAVLSEPFPVQGLEIGKLMIERFMIALAPGHDHACQTQLSAKMLKRDPILMLEDGHCLRGQTQQFCEKLGLRPDIHIEASSIESLRQMVSVGMGCAILPELAVQGPFASSTDVAVRPLADVQASRSLVLAWRGRNSRHDHLAKLAFIIRDQLSSLPTGATGGISAES